MLLFALFYSLLSVPIIPDCVLSKRREWRELDIIQQKKYIDAELCLKKIPSIIDTNFTSNNVYDDLVYVHEKIMSKGHGNHDFLPFHRYFVLVHDKFMKQFCKYDGPFPYWDWSIDSQVFKY